MKAVLEELSNRGGDTSLTPQDGSSTIPDIDIAELAKEPVPTGDGLTRTMEEFEAANGEGSLKYQQTINSPTTNNTTVEKGEGFLVQGPSTNDSDLSWMGKRNYVATAT